MKDLSQSYDPAKYESLQEANYDANLIASLTTEPYEVVRHHPTVVGTMYALCARWKANCDNLDLQSGRCEKCWTRKAQCYCAHLADQRLVYTPTPAPVTPSADTVANPLSIQGCEVIMYYAPKELGRTPNTAHLFEELLPYCTRRIIIGDEMAEQRLIAEMVQEYRDGRPRTCIMYPTADAQLLSEWSQKAKASWEANAGGTISSDGAAQHVQANSKIRLIALDGTYSCAGRLYKHLHRCMTTALAAADKSENPIGPNGLPMVPVVKLDLADGGCRSAMAGIMQQPGKEKVCTYQAVVMALQQLGESPVACASLHQDLDRWIEYILENSIKMCKAPEKIQKLAPKGLSQDQVAPAAYVQKYVDRNVERTKVYLQKAEEKAKMHNPRTGKDKIVDGSECAAETEAEAEKGEGDVVETVYETTPVSDVQCYTVPICTSSSIAPPATSAPADQSSKPSSCNIC